MRQAGIACLAALMTAALLACPPARGEEIGAYGGSGEDILLEAVACRDGLFAAGRTASADKDLSMRTREGETGWAVRIDAEGEILWSLCSAHVGLQTMTAPLAMEDGSFSVVLTNDAGMQGEWIVIDEDGKQQMRMDVPEAEKLCAHGGTVSRMIPAEGPEGCRLMILLDHPDGETCCLSCLRQDGSVRTGEPFSCSGDAAVGRGGDGSLALADEEGGALRITRIEADGSSRQTAKAGAFWVEHVHEIWMAEDGSVLACGSARLQDGDSAGFLMRLSTGGETLIEETFAQYDSIARLTTTDTGFALLGRAEGAEKVLFIDEDGILLSEAQAPAATMDLIPAEGGAAALSHLSGRGQRQAILTRILQPESGPEMLDEDARLEALAQERLLLEQTPEPTGTPEPTPTPAPMQAGADEPEDLPAGEGYLRCRPDGFGVQVTYVGMDGREIFHTRTPIHTAADMLEWICAANTDEGMLLGGRYLTGEGAAARQEAVVALLTDEGVLRRIETLSGAGAVCAMELTEDGVLLHASTDVAPSLAADTAIPFAL